MSLHELEFFVCVVVALAAGICFGVYNEKRLRPGGLNRYGYLIGGLALLLLVSILIVAFAATS